MVLDRCIPHVLPTLHANDEEEATRFQCRHIFPDGHRCGSPALREENFCYYHHTARRPAQARGRRPRRQARFEIAMPCDLTDRSGIQQVVGTVLQKLAGNEIDARRAGVLLYGLQIASLNLPRRNPKAETAEPEPVTDLTLDPNHGPLAPPTEYIGVREKKGSAELLLEELERMDREKARAEPEDVWIE